MLKVYSTQCIAETICEDVDFSEQLNHLKLDVNKASFNDDAGLIFLKEGSNEISEGDKKATIQFIRS